VHYTRDTLKQAAKVLLFLKKKKYIKKKMTKKCILLNRNSKPGFRVLGLGFGEEDGLRPTGRGKPL